MSDERWSALLQPSSERRWSGAEVLLWRADAFSSISGRPDYHVVVIEGEKHRKMLDLRTEVWLGLADPPIAPSSCALSMYCAARDHEACASRLEQQISDVLATTFPGG